MEKDTQSMLFELWMRDRLRSLQRKLWSQAASGQKLSISFCRWWNITYIGAHDFTANFHTLKNALNLVLLVNGAPKVQATVCWKAKWCTTEMTQTQPKYEFVCPNPYICFWRKGFHSYLEFVCAPHLICPREDFFQAEIQRIGEHN